MFQSLRPLASHVLRRAAQTAPNHRALSSGGAPVWHATTILSVRKNGAVCVVGDGQVTQGSMVVKPNARKVRRLGPNNEVVAGFAGATADALTLFEIIEQEIEQHPGQLLRACVNLAKNWRMDRALRRLDATLLICDRDMSLYVTGTGDVLEPPDGIIGIGSGSTFAIAAARALMPIEGLNAQDVATRSLQIAADMCVYTNDSFVVECIGDVKGEPDPLSDTESSAKDKDGKK